MGNRWLSAEEICAYLGIGRDKVYMFIGNKGLPFRIGLRFFSCSIVFQLKT